MEEHGISSWPSDWTARCEALCRKSGTQCPHTCDCQIPTILTMHQNLESNDSATVSGRPVKLCRSHWLSWRKRAKKLLSLPLIEQGHLSPFNKHGYGAIVVKDDRLDFSTTPIAVRLVHRWGWIGYRGRVPAEKLARIPRFLDFMDEGMVLTAKKLASRAHAGRKRRDGITPYIRHCEDVAKRVAGDPMAEAAAWLHDVLEDTWVMAFELRTAMIYEEVINAVKVLTKIKGMDYTQYIHKVASNELARKVKIAEMLSNLDDDPTEKQKKKYAEGLSILKSFECNTPH